ncbi:hypothetical protein OS493_036824 [Desmophyllum pertusum]|uniref:BZIP domain-containing protein n=1 Tax=Desmophyllum pertusum TaxID=174260 RepID=A0A9W9ZVH3_9CNID|nr:hypothetical protein OS493_036824 [Desmophyllum pertusum]
MDLDQLFPELPLLDTLTLGFEAEPTFPVAASDICQSDVVTELTGRTGGEYMEVPSPGSEIIDVVSLESDAEVSSSTGDLSDIALSPESVVSMEEDDHGSLPPSVQRILDCEQAEPASEEITVVQTSDALTLLTQELTQSSFSYASEFIITPSTERQLEEDSAEDLSTITVDIDELFSLSDSLGLADSLVFPSVSDVCSENIVTSSTSEISVQAQPKQKRKRSCSSESANLSAKKVKRDDVDEERASRSHADKRTVRRLKNNVASKHARASRRQKEQDLFQQEEELERSNAELRKQLEDLQQLTTMLRKVLVEKLSGGTCPV